MARWGLLFRSHGFAPFPLPELAQFLRDEILADRLPVGTPLPSEGLSGAAKWFRALDRPRGREDAQRGRLCGPGRTGSTTGRHPTDYRSVAPGLRKASVLGRRITLGALIEV